MTEFPGLPAPVSPLISWPASVISAHELVASQYRRSSGALKLDDGNLGRLRSMYHSIETDLLPLWFNLESAGLPKSYIDLGLDTLALLFVQLGESVEMLEAQ
jgi:hypothetical protein